MQRSGATLGRMEIAFAAVIGLAIGGTLAWVVVSARAKAASAALVGSAERRAEAAEATVAEVRAQGQRATAASEALRVAFDAEREARVRAETQMSETR